MSAMARDGFVMLLMLCKPDVTGRNFCSLLLYLEAALFNEPRSTHRTYRGCTDRLHRSDKTRDRTRDSPQNASLSTLSPLPEPEHTCTCTVRLPAQTRGPWQPRATIRSHSHLHSHPLAHSHCHTPFRSLHCTHSVYARITTSTTYKYSPSVRRRRRRDRITSKRPIVTLYATSSTMSRAAR